KNLNPKRKRKTKSLRFQIKFGISGQRTATFPFHKGFAETFATKSMKGSPCKGRNNHSIGRCPMHNASFGLALEERHNNSACRILFYYWVPAHDRGGLALGGTQGPRCFKMLCFFLKKKELYSRVAVWSLTPESKLVLFFYA